MKSFQKQIIKANVASWQLNTNFKLSASSRCPRPGDEVETSWRLNISYISDWFAYKWSNVHGLESPVEQLFTYKFMTFGAAERTIDFNSLSISLNETKHSLA